MTEKRRVVLNGASKTQLALLADAISKRGSEWMDQAICPETDPDMFVPDREMLGGTSAVYFARKGAKRVCASCPVTSECLEHALKYHEIGIWGGTDDNERTEIRRQRDAK